MAIKVIGRITLYEQLNQSKIDALLAGSDVIVFEVDRRYLLADKPNVLSAILPTQFEDVSIDYIEALKLVVDASTWIHEENVVMYKINYESSTKDFDLSESYIRDDRDTTVALTSLPNGQHLKATFVTPGLEESVITTIDLLYATAISTLDEEALANVGLILKAGSKGDAFGFSSQATAYKVIFSQPDTVITEKYSIEFDLQNKPIEV